MLLSLFLTCFAALVLATVLLFAAGKRLRVASMPLGLLLTIALAAVAGEAAARLWQLPSDYVLGGEALLVVTGVGVVIRRRDWNPIGQAFYVTFLASAVSYLAFALVTTLDDGLSLPARAASFVLLAFEVAALALSASFTAESCDAICRVRAARRTPPRDPDHRPMVSLQLATYNEPPDMLIDTIKALEAIDYERFEIVVIDNNTKDEDVWRPVAEYCRDRPNVTFVHVDPWPGFKSGALNLALAEHTHPDAEIIGVVDADYTIDPTWLADVVGYFADPSVAFVQTPQDYREFAGDDYLEACYDAYAYFFKTSMPYRQQRNSIIFAGTMGLVRRSALVEVGGWDEWCITEDAELSLRMLKAGHQGVFVPTSYGHGIMPLTFSALKSQRFRWCFGGMQILRMHWRALLPGRRTERNQLTHAQRVDYLLGSLQWMNDLVYLGFTITVLASAAVLLADGPFGLRPLYGAAVLLPSALIVTGVVRAVWALRVKTGIGVRRAVLAFANWLALSWTVALACVQGLVRREGVFMRTPKDEDRNRLVAALWAARGETLLALLVWGAGIAVASSGRATPFVVLLFAWQGLVYASAPFMSWLNQHTELSAQLERRRRSEWRRERRNTVATVVGTMSGAAAATAIALVFFVGGSDPGTPADPFATPSREPSDDGPLAELVDDPSSGGSSPSSTSTTGASTTTSAGETTTTVPGESSTTSASTTTIAPTTTVTTASTTTTTVATTTTAP